MVLIGCPYSNSCQVRQYYDGANRGRDRQNGLSKTTVSSGLKQDSNQGTLCKGRGYDAKILSFLHIDTLQKTFTFYQRPSAMVSSTST